MQQRLTGPLEPLFPQDRLHAQVKLGFFKRSHHVMADACMAHGQGHQLILRRGQKQQLARLRHPLMEFDERLQPPVVQDLDRFVLRSITDEIMYELMLLSGQEYVDVYATSLKKNVLKDTVQTAVAKAQEIQKTAQEIQKTAAEAAKAATEAARAVTESAKTRATHPQEPLETQEAVEAPDSAASTGSVDDDGPSSDEQGRLRAS